MSDGPMAHIFASASRAPRRARAAPLRSGASAAGAPFTPIFPVTSISLRNMRHRVNTWIFSLSRASEFASDSSAACEPCPPRPVPCWKFLAEKRAATIPRCNGLIVSGETWLTSEYRCRRRGCRNHDPM